MLRHYRSKHEGIRYPCNQCTYQATQKGDLQKHIQAKHEGIKHPCNQCDYQATTQGNLQSHITAKHSDNILKCDHCDYQTKWRQSYYRHKNKNSCRVVTVQHLNMPKYPVGEGRL